jgi:hypothetical protein
MSINSLGAGFYEIDKWFALIAGNIIGTNLINKHFFNSKLRVKNLFNLIRNSTYYSKKVPYWGREYFTGINMRKNQELIGYDHIDASGVNFAYSYFKKFIINNSQLINCNFSNSVFENFNITESDIRFSKFDNIEIKGYPYNEDYDDAVFEGVFSLTFCFIAQGVLFPGNLNTVLKGTTTGLTNQGSEFSNIGQQYGYSSRFTDEYLKPLRGLFKIILELRKNKNIILASFKFQQPNDSLRKNKKGVVENKKTNEKQFKEFIDEIEQEVKNSKLL